MNPFLIQVITGLVAFGLVCVAVRKASVDGFFATLCTAAVLYVACRFAYLQWEGFYHFFMDAFDMDSGNLLEKMTGLSASYWTGFVMVLLPAMLYVKLLTREPVPFPAWVERYGTLVLGVVCGLIFFGVLFNGASKLDFFQEHLRLPMRPYRLMLEFMQLL